MQCTSVTIFNSSYVLPVILCVMTSIMPQMAMEILSTECSMAMNHYLRKPISVTPRKIYYTKGVITRVKGVKTHLKAK